MDFDHCRRRRKETLKFPPSRASGHGLAPRNRRVEGNRVSLRRLLQSAFTFHVPVLRSAFDEGGSILSSQKPRKLSFKEQRELEGMEAAITAAEARVQELETTLNDPQFHATRSREAHGLLAELETVKVEVARLYERWEELSSRQKRA